MKRTFAFALALAACASSHGDRDTPDAPPAGVDATPPDSDGFPRGAISFFLSTLCPAGWAPYADAVGRTVVPSAPGDVGVTGGAPLAPNQRNRHRHDLAITADLATVNYAGIAGEANHGVARGGAVTGTSATDDTDPDVPYAQFLVCTKVEDAGAMPPPSRVIAFFAAGACPASWTDAPAELQGRFLVARPVGGMVGATFGGPPLTSGEVRTHQHAVSATLATGSHGIALASGGAAGGYARAGDHATTTVAQPAAVELPYLQLLACVSP